MSNDSSGGRIYQRALALAYEEPPDNGRVLALLEKAMELGDADAMYALGTWFLYGKPPFVQKDLTKAFDLIERAASKNVVSALFELAISLELGEVGEPDEHRAFTCYLRAAIRGEKQSIFEVSRMLFWGLGVPQDRELADIWLDYAIEVGADVEYESVESSVSPRKRIHANREKSDTTNNKL
jgi:TPR repeat protein